MRRALLLSLAAVAALALAPLARGGVKTVEVRDNFFDPEKVSVGLGSTVDWEWGPPGPVGSGEPHNVVQDKRVFSSGGLTRNDSFSRDFSAGKFRYYCTLHGARGGVGMSGIVKTRPSSRKKPAGRPFTVIWARKRTNTGDEFDVRFKVGKRKWKNWKKNTSRRKGVFGKRRKPVRVKRNKVYKLQARSQKSKRRQSGWSPKLKVRT